MDELITYLFAHKTILKENNRKQFEKWVLMEYNKTFTVLFVYEIMKDFIAYETLT